MFKHNSAIDIAVRLKYNVITLYIAERLFYLMQRLNIAEWLYLTANSYAQMVSVWRDAGILKGNSMKTIQDMQDLGKAIRDRRRELGYTQAFLADYAGISASFLSELENGKETIQAGKMMDVISLLGMDICVKNRGE